MKMKLEEYRAGLTAPAFNLHTERRMNMPEKEEMEKIEDVYDFEDPRGKDEPEHE